MNAFVRILLRIVLMALGYAAACLVASAIIQIVYFASSGSDAAQIATMLAGPLLFWITVFAIVVGYIVFIPAVPMIIVLEVAGRRDWLSYALAGTAVGAVIAVFLAILIPGGPTQIAPGQDSYTGLGTPTVLATLTGAGILAGLTYWAVAGRWRALRASSEDTPP